MMKKNLLLLLTLIIATGSFGKPPKPPIGKRWVLNTDYSDEFNGTALNLDKWFNYHPTWKGRSPGLFMPSQVSVNDGYLQIKGEKMAKDTVISGYEGDITYNIKCGAVVSRKTTAHYGYYECKFKANKTTLSTTFWFTGRKQFDGPMACSDKYGQEWDVQECIGREGDFNGKYFASGMHSNAHYWYTDCDGEKFDHRATQVKFEDEKPASEDYNIYGGWWKDAKTAVYYYNNGDPQSQTFYDELSPEPFSNPMGMNMVVETYPYPWISLPNDEELADPEKNTSYYDWVRAYYLVDAFEPKPIVKPTPIVENGDFETGSRTPWVSWGNPGGQITNNLDHVANGDYACHILGAGAPGYLLVLKPNTDYTVTCNAKSISGSITLGVKDNESGTTINTLEVTANDYQSYTLKFNSGLYAPKLFFYAQDGEEGYIDDVVITEDNPEVPVEEEPLALYDETVSLKTNFSQNWETQVVSIPFEFKANEDREIHLKLKNMDDVIVADTVLNAYAGYANAVVHLKIDSVLTKAAFSLYADIRTIEGTEADIIHTESITLANVSVKTPKAEVLKVYPSPTSSELYIGGIHAGIKYSIFNMQGKLVDNQLYLGQGISVSDLPSGMYIIQVNERKGRFVKK